MSKSVAKISEAGELGVRSQAWVGHDRWLLKPTVRWVNAQLQGVRFGSKSSKEPFAQDCRG